jgi:ribosomal-protein-alanine N-acetyltransferase
VIVRRATLEDVTAVADLDWRALHEPFLLGCHAQERRESLTAVWPGFAESAGAHLYVAEDGDGLLGFAAVREVVGEAEVDAIAVEPRARKRGIGRVLLGRVDEDLRALWVTRIGLEVRASNVAARRLYAACGFEAEGLRKRYYENGEDAILLGKTLVVAAMVDSLVAAS